VKAALVAPTHRLKTALFGCIKKPSWAPKAHIQAFNEFFAGAHLWFLQAAAARNNVQNSFPKK
jgi:hypothetical protein